MDHRYLWTYNKGFHHSRHTRSRIQCVNFLGMQLSDSCVGFRHSRCLTRILTWILHGKTFSRKWFWIIEHMQHTLHTIPFDIPTCSIYTLHISIQSYSRVSTNLLSIWVPRSIQVGYPEDIISDNGQSF